MDASHAKQARFSFMCLICEAQSGRVPDSACSDGSRTDLCRAFLTECWETPVSAGHGRPAADHAVQAHDPSKLESGRVPDLSASRKCRTALYSTVCQRAAFARTDASSVSTCRVLPVRSCSSCNS